MSLDSFPIVSVKDVAATADFYAQLGFVQTYAFPESGPPAFVTLARGTHTIGIAARDADSERFAYWVYVDDVDETFNDLTRAGASVVVEPRDEPWGERVASVRDPDGNPVHLGTPIDDQQ